MEDKVLCFNEFSIGDTVEIIDSSGCPTGNMRDRGILQRIRGDFIRKDVVFDVLLSTGKWKGQTSARYYYKHKKINLDWDE